MVIAVDSVLVVRRSIHIKASPERVWQEFESSEQMSRWWGLVVGDTNAGSGNGQHLRIYEPRVGGRIEMEITLDGEPTRYGGAIKVYDPGCELTFESDWIPNRGWLQPTLVTIRLTPALGGTLVELMHHGFENTGPGAFDEFVGYEEGWGMLQLIALRNAVQQG